MRPRLVIAGAAVLVACAAAHAQAPLPIFDSHIHYSHDAWERVPPREAIAILRKAGVRAAMVSSSNDDGTQKLHTEAPDLVIPVLRPYRVRGDVSSWVRDASIVPHVEARLRTYRYAAIGEYHVFGADADLPVVRRMVELAKQYKLYLHSHSDADAIERQFRQDPNARILWAHAGFDAPERVREMLRKYPNLWCDLAFRSDHARNGKVDPGWREAFLEFPDRFMVGTDTYTAERWSFVGEHANWSREWLADLPRDVAERIAYRNGERLFGAMLERQKQQ
jgi:hypothetical protein